MSALRVLDLFSGIGGFSLGLEAAGRLHGLGNAVVPQVPEVLGRALVTAEAEMLRAAA